MGYLKMRRVLLNAFVLVTMLCLCKMVAVQASDNVWAKPRTKSPEKAASPAKSTSTKTVASAAKSISPKKASAGDLPMGKDLYLKSCAPCHGEEGDGWGPLAHALYPKPRDFTMGQYKIRTNPTGSLPTDEDLIHIIYTGLHGTSMIPWDILSMEQIESLLPVLKGFSEAWQYRKPEPPVTIGREIPSSRQSIARGKELYFEKECWKCHGEEGHGDGPSSYDLKDEWDFPIQAYDFTRASKFKGGATSRDIYLRFTTGINGTPMPSFARELSDEDRWSLVHFVQSLAKKAEKHEHHGHE
ncbi:MAG: c-type cytochrome [Planctomycetes bacterium]|nr:c-type cytochrome [Planctomycetota bacterium]